jgi:RING finger family protein
MLSGDLILVLAVIVSVAGASAILFVRSRWRSRQNIGLYRAAVRLNGTVVDADGMEMPLIRFTAEGRPAMVEFERGDDPLTRVRVLMPRRSPGVFRILREKFARANARFIGSPDLKIGHPEFDRIWYITARPSSLAQRIFTAERRDQVIESVLRIGALPSPSIEITRDTLIVRVSGILLHEDDLSALARTAIDFVGYLIHLGPEEGIAWVATGDAEPGICPVCASALAEGVIFCDKCRTPQHEECWVYVGQCSTYACKGKRFST